MSRGIKRERYVQDWLEARGWWVCRAAGSLGDADLVALADPISEDGLAEDPPMIGGRRIYDGKLLIEVKSTITPYSHFGPEDRDELLEAGRRAGADVVLCWTPSARGKRIELHWYYPEDWPRWAGQGRVLSNGQDSTDGGSDDACVRETGL